MPSSLQQPCGARTCEGGDSHGGEEDLPEGRALEELEGDHEGGSDPGDEEEGHKEGGEEGLSTLR